MIEALRLEVATIKERGSSTHVDLRGGEKIGTAENNFLYRFPVREDLKSLRDDTPAHVVCDGVELEGHIVSVTHGSVTVALDADLGPNITLARLTTDDSFLTEKLCEKLEQIDKGTAHFNHKLAASVVGAVVPESDLKEPVPQVFSDAVLNDDQKNAVRLAFGSQTSFIWGPPGTGKTTTLAHVVESHYRAGNSVLIVSNTNVAVDTALQRIAQRLETEPEFHEGAVLRHGPLGKDLDERYGERLNVDKIVERLGKEIGVQKQDLQNELRQEKFEAEPLKVALACFNELKRLKSEIQRREEAFQSKQNHSQELQDKLRTGQTKSNKLQVNLDRSRDFGAIRRLLTGLNPQRIEAELNELRRANSNLEGALAATSRQLDEQSVELERLHRNLVETKATVPDYQSEAQVKLLLAPIENSIAQIETKLRTIEEQLAALRDHILKNCRILATTASRTYLKGLVNRNFDVVIIDEASMLMLPLTFFAAGLANKAVVVAGDFRQLSPIVRSNDTLAIEWLKKDAFEKTNIPREVRAQATPKHLAILSVQHRMHPEICSCVNALFYNDRPLETPPGIGSGAKHFPLGDSRLLFIDTTELKPWSAYKLGTYSRYNLLHALLIRNLVTSLDEHLIGAAGDYKLGIISPFSAQTSLVQAHLNDHFAGRGAELAATAHRFQGNERDSIIIDLTDSPSTPLSGFMRAIRDEEEGARLLNVAISRARHRIILVANFGFLRNEAPKEGKLQRLLDHFQEYGKPINAIDILNLRQEDWAEGLFYLRTPVDVDLSDADAQFLTEGTFYPRFTEDIGTATRSILILSPYLSGRGTRRWIELLKVAINKGVRVQLITLPNGGLTSHGSSEILAELREFGVLVDHRSKFHEKIAIIDEEILWHGSLNILSHRDTSESMLRMRSAAACARLGAYVTRPFTRKRRTDAGARDASIGRRDSKPCPRVGCGGQLIKRNSKNGPFLGCTNFYSKNCRETENL